MSTTDKQRQRAMERTLKGWSFPNFDILIKQPEHPEYKTHYGYALNYASMMFEAEELKGEAEVYAEANLNLSLSKVPKWEFLGVGVQTWLLNKKVPMTEEKIEGINQRLKTLHKKYSINDNQEIWTPTPSQAKLGEVFAELDGVVDDAVMKRQVTQPYKILTEKAAGTNLTALKKKYEDELSEVTDPELKESFPNAKILEVVLKIIIKDIEKFQAAGGEKKVRAPRKPKKINPSKMVKKLKYLKSFPELKLSSIEPEKIVGSQILWVYNTKTRKLGKLVAQDETGLLIKGSTVFNFNEAESILKKIRKPEEVLGKLAVAGKVEQRKVLDHIRAVAVPMKGRINKDCILVKAF